MSETGIRIWCNMEFPAAAQQMLLEGVRGQKFEMARSLTASNLSTAEADPGLAQAEVAFGQPDPAAVLKLEKIKWVHLTSAGYERWARPEIVAGLKGRGVAVTNSSCVYDDPCAQHALALMMAAARDLPTAMRNQREEHGWPITEIRSRNFLLTGQSVVILGYGAIARRLIELLAPFGMRILAVRQTPQGDDVVKTVRPEEAEAAIGEADHVVSVLPGGDSTRHFMNASRLDAMRQTAIFYNVGRGTTVDQEALLKALKGGVIRGAFLDVTDPEPLPKEHPLWTAPNCYITPHTAGGHDTEFFRLVQAFLGNLRAYGRGEGLTGRVV